MKILILGGGGREHALAWKLAQSPLITKIYVAPGNAGTALEPKTKNVPIDPADNFKIAEFARNERISLTIPGPELPLVKGIVDDFRIDNLSCFGPSRQAAMLEGSKVFSKEFLLTNKIPTARAMTFSDYHTAKEYMQYHTDYPCVIKADGLAAGKGVFIINNYEEAEYYLRRILQQHMLDHAGDNIVVEEYLRGEELSFIVITDGHTALPLVSAQDHKTRDEGDEGPNTGGMGAYSPSPLLTPVLEERIMKEIIYPTIKGMAARGMPYQGFLYAGLMITPEGAPKVLEFNCRLGDPETQVILPRMKSDLLKVLLLTMEGRLSEIKIDWDERPCLGVVLTAQGYPDEYRKNDIIKCPTRLNNKSVKIFHGGTLRKNRQVLTNGGRVMCVTALDKTISAAQTRAYKAIQHIHWEGMYYRRDIGHRAVAREKETV